MVSLSPGPDFLTASRLTELSHVFMWFGPFRLVPWVYLIHSLHPLLPMVLTFYAYADRCPMMELLGIFAVQYGSR